MNKYKLPALLAVAGLVAVGSIAALASKNASPPPTGKATVDETRMALRDLWVEHVFWVRNYVVANEAKNPGARDAAAAEVVANAKQIAGAIEPFYGKAASDQLLKLLAGHWGAVKSVSDATTSPDAARREAAMKELSANAKEIATFLSGANPHLPYETLFGALTAHGAHHVAQIDQLHAANYAEEARTWTMMRGHMLVIADTLANGLAAQFPDKF